MRRSAFLCYRRDDSAGYAGRLYDRLRRRFGRRVFMDVGDIDPGSDALETIERAVGGCAVLVALIGREWLAGGRLNDPEDFVRMEVQRGVVRRFPAPRLENRRPMDNSADRRSPL